MICGGIVLSLMMSVAGAALPEQSLLPVQQVIKLERINSERIHKHQQTWEHYFTKMNVRTTLGYTALAAAVIGTLAYCMLHKSPVAKNEQPVPAPHGVPANHDIEIFRLLQRVVGDGTFVGWLKNSLMSMGGMCVIAGLLVAVDRLAMPLTKGVASWWGQSPEDNLVQLTHLMLANRLRLDDSCARLHALANSADPLQQKIRSYMMHDVMIDTDAFVHSCENWVGFLGAALQRASLDTTYSCQITNSLNNLVALINDATEHEEKMLNGNAAGSITTFTNEIYNECVRMAHLMDMLLYGNKNTPPLASMPA